MVTLPNTGIEVPDVGADSDLWGGILNAALAEFDAYMQDVGGTPAQRLANGGTGAVDAAGARTNLGIGAMGTAADAPNDGAAYVRKSLAWALLAWADISNKPTVFPPSAHTHPMSDVVDLDNTISLINAEIDALTANDLTIIAASKTVVSATYTANHLITSADGGKILYYDSATAGTFTVPANATDPIPVDTRIDLSQFGTGELTIAPEASVTVLSFGNLVKLGGQYAGATLHKKAANTWVLFGNLS